MTELPALSNFWHWRPGIVRGANAGHFAGTSSFVDRIEATAGKGLPGGAPAFPGLVAWLQGRGDRQVKRSAHIGPIVLSSYHSTARERIAAEFRYSLWPMKFGLAPAKVFEELGDRGRVPEQVKQAWKIVVAARSQT